MSDRMKKMTRRDFLKVGAATAMTGALAACAPAAAPTAAPAAKVAATTAPAAPAVSKGAKKTVRYLGWWFEEGNRGKTHLAFVDEFNKSQNDIEVKAENIPFDNYTTKMVVGAQSGSLDGDVLAETPELAPRLINADMLAPLDDVLTKNNIKDLSSAHDAMKKNGHLYGLDVVTVAFGLLYNKVRYEEAKITPAKTPDEWVEVCKKLTDRAKQKYGFFATHLIKEPSDFWFQLELWCMPYGGVWAKGKTPMLTSEPIIKGLKLFKAIYDGAQPQQVDGNTGYDLFGTGAVAQGIYVSAAVGSLKPKYPDQYDNWRSAPIPWESNTSIARIHPLMISKASKVIPEALEFITYVYKPANYKRLVMGCEDVIFAQKSAEDTAYLDKLAWLKPGYYGVKYLTPFDVVGDFVYNFNELGQIVITHFSDCLTANKPVEEAMAAAQKEAEALAARIS